MSTEEEIWQDLIQGNNMIQARERFSGKGIDRVGMVKRGLHGNAHEVWTALRIISYMEVSERIQVFDELVFRLITQRYGSYARKLILDLPREWVVEHIERVAEPLPEWADDFEYSALLGLYLELDTNLTMKLAQVAAAHPDPEIAELGIDCLTFLALLEKYPCLRCLGQRPRSQEGRSGGAEPWTQIFRDVNLGGSRDV